MLLPDLINQFDPRYLPLLHRIHASDDPLQPAGHFLVRKWLDLVVVQKFLCDFEPAFRKLPVSWLGVSFEGSLPIDRLVEHGEANDPVWLNAATRVPSDRKGVETEIFPSLAANCCVTYLHGSGIANTV